MDEPIYVPAPSGQEAIVVLIRDTERRPTEADMRVIRSPVVAWRILRVGALQAIPVLPREPFDYHHVLITLAEGRLYSMDIGETFYSLDEALKILLHRAQTIWDRRHP